MSGWTIRHCTDVSDPWQNPLAVEVPAKVHELLPRIASRHGHPARVAVENAPPALGGW